MTAGLPGTGIGGLFYLFSAAGMPLRHVYLRIRGRADAGAGRIVAAQLTIAAGILGGMWLAGWMLGLLFRTAAPVAFAASMVHPASNVLRISMLLIGVATLVGVLTTVEVLRWAVHRDRTVRARAPVTRVAAPAPRRLRIKRRATLILLVSLAYGRPVAAQEDVLARCLARGDSAWIVGDRATAEREYAMAVSVDPWNSRATYRLAELRRNRPAEALLLYRRYVDLEPTDPWGYMAVGAALSREGRQAAALKWYDAALRLAPSERDAVIGRARVLTKDRRLAAASGAYASWLAQHPDDAEANSELAVLRAKTAGILVPFVQRDGDSDGNNTTRVGLTFDSPLMGTSRFGLAASREQVTDAARVIDFAQIGLRGTWQFGSALLLETTLGAGIMPSRRDTVFAPGPGNSGGGRRSRAGPVDAVPTGLVRMRWRAPAGGPSLDLRAQRSVLTASPQLLGIRVVRSEIRGLTELPLFHPVRLRGLGRAAVLSDSSSPVYRTGAGGGLVFALTPAVELAAQGQSVRYSRASTAGFFSPRQAQLMEAATYAEFEPASGMIVALDGGVGVQRAQAYGAVMGPWTRALRLYALVGMRLGPARELRLEFDGEDSAIGSETATTAGWQHASLAVSLRWGLR